ncbi:MAG: glycosyltransferase family 2 protein [Candidatus Woesearchaeota archaeon]
MKQKPLVSVVMPNYNGERFIKEAIESILQQSYNNFEFIIVDDCSTDSSWDIIQTYAKKDSRIKAFKNSSNMKIVATRNKGFSLCSKKSTYVAIFDSDDISHKKRLEKQVVFLEKNTHVGAIGGHTYIINEEGNVVFKRTYPLTFSKKKVLFKSPFAQPAVMLRKSVLDTVGVYKVECDFDRARDFDLWIRIQDSYDIATLNAFVLYYRISSTQGKKTHLKETLRSTIQVQKKWMFKKKYFSFSLCVYVCLEYMLLLLPERIILYLFKRKEYTQ